MIIKKFQALNEQDAIILAKEELGKNVIIMNVKKITPKGLARIFKKPKVEITAAIDDEKSYDNVADKKKEILEAKLQNAIQEKVEQEEKKKGSKKLAKKADKKLDKKTDIKAIVNENEFSKNDEEFNIDKIQALLEAKSKELDIMTKTAQKAEVDKKSVIEKESALEKKSVKKDDKKQILEELRTAESKDKTSNKQEIIQDKTDIEETTEVKKTKEEKSDKYVKLIKRQLLKHEVDEQYIDMIINEVKGNIKKDTLVDNILTSVYQKIILKLGTPKLIEPGANQPKYVFFMGPTGVGKTTTIAKIASDFKLNRKLNVALLTSDTYRIAAVEQLRIYANILKVPINIAYSAEDIVKLKPKLDRYDIVLIDTAGRSHKNKEQCDDLRELISSIDKKERDMYLVLSATTKYSDLQKIVEAYSDIEDYKLLFTKTDETTHLGNILNIKLLTNAKLSYIANGQDVPTDIGKVDAQDIAKQLLGGGM